MDQIFDKFHYITMCVQYQLYAIVLNICGGDGDTIIIQKVRQILWYQNKCVHFMCISGKPSEYKSINAYKQTVYLIAELITTRLAKRNLNFIRTK